jgi:dCMP deaminase
MNAASEKWDERFLRLAEHISTWSKDPSTAVGSCIVRPDKTIASLGFNGLPRLVEDSHERLHDRDLKYKLVIHSELNAILNAKESLAGYTQYVFPFHPCSACAAAIIQAGITRVVAPVSDNPRWVTSFELAGMMFSEAGVAVDLVDTPII